MAIDKAVDSTLLDELFSNIGEAIRTMNGTSEMYDPDDMPPAILAIEPKSQIIVTAPTGSTVTCSNGTVTKTATESSGIWTFSGCDVGTWTVSASNGSQSAAQTVSITEDGQLMRYYVAITYFAATINITVPAGSTVTCEKSGTATQTATATGGSCSFTVTETGTYTITATLSGKTAGTAASITSDGQTVSLTLSYTTRITDFDWASYGTLNSAYKIIDSSGNNISQSEWETAEDWRAQLLTSGTLKTLNDCEIDVFLVGGGGGGGANKGGGGGGGKTKTVTGVSLTKDTSYQITIGAGGSAGSSSTSGGSGGTTSAFNNSIAGGSGGAAASNARHGGAGGSGGGGGSNDSDKGAKGGSDGGSGSSSGTNNGGSGQGTTTREFGSSSGTQYAGGGGGGSDNSGGSGGSGGGGAGGVNSGTAGTANTGGGGGGCKYGKTAGKGGSGIVVIRPA